METLLAILTGFLFAAGLFSILRRSIVKIVIGLILMGHATNLLIFTSAGLTRNEPPIIPDGAPVPDIQVIADPLPQALILTAIVIGFGVIAFTLVLIDRTYHVAGHDDLDEMKGLDD